MAMIKRRSAILATMFGCLLGVGLFAAVPANAAQPAQHAAVTALHALPSSSSGRPAVVGAPAGTILATASAARLPTRAHVNPAITPATFTCSVRSSGLYLLQPGAQWGPYFSAYTNDAVADTAYAYCNAPAPSYEVQASILWNGSNYAGNEFWSYNTTVTSTAYDITECSAGTFQAGGYALITLPPGYAVSYFYLYYPGPSFETDFDSCIPEDE
jgi:hypothetical protein